MATSEIDNVCGPAPRREDFKNNKSYKQAVKARSKCWKDYQKQHGITERVEVRQGARTDRTEITGESGASAFSNAADTVRGAVESFLGGDTPPEEKITLTDQLEAGVQWVKENPVGAAVLGGLGWVGLKALR